MQMKQLKLQVIYWQCKIYLPKVTSSTTPCKQANEMLAHSLSSAFKYYYILEKQNGVNSSSWYSNITYVVLLCYCACITNLTLRSILLLCSKHWWCLENIYYRLAMSGIEKHSLQWVWSNSSATQRQCLALPATAAAFISSSCWWD